MQLVARVSAVAILAGAAIVGATAATASGYHVEYAFTGGSDAAHPDAALTKYAGKLYGTTPFGGAHNSGAVYAFDPATGAETVVHSFKGGADGNVPDGSLIKVGGKLYGTTSEGGAGGNNGTVFSFDPATGAETVVYSFTGGGDGSAPKAGLINVGGTLYGTTIAGGSLNCNFGCGVVFSLDPTTGAEAVVYAFQGGSDGQHPAAGLIDHEGRLYGTAESGGSVESPCPAVGCGTVFSVDRTTGAETVVYAFEGGADGADPMAGLIKVGGKLYGTTKLGGISCPVSACGTVFSLNPTTGAKTTVYSFQGGKDGSLPNELIEVLGTLYGTTEDGGHVRGGGHRNGGTVFSLNLTTNTETVLHAFLGGLDGSQPTAGLLSDGQHLWGTTLQEGQVGQVGVSTESKRVGYGTIFSLTP